MTMYLAFVLMFSIAADIRTIRLFYSFKATRCDVYLLNQHRVESRKHLQCC